MKKIISILFISLYLLAYTHVKEVFKLGLLLEHFQEHQSNSDINFIDFLAAHYSFENIKDSDFEKDMSLPFKSNDKNICIVNGYLLPEKITINWETPKLIFTEKKSEIHYKNPFLKTAPSKNLLRPPQFV